MDKDTKTLLYVAGAALLAYLLFFRKPTVNKTVVPTQTIVQAPTSTNSTGSTLAGLGSLAGGLGSLAGGLGSAYSAYQDDQSYN